MKKQNSKAAPETDKREQIYLNLVGSPLVALIDAERKLSGITRPAQVKLILAQHYAGTVRQPQPQTGGAEN